MFLRRSSRLSFGRSSNFCTPFRPLVTTAHSLAKAVYVAGVALPVFTNLLISTCSGLPSCGCIALAMSGDGALGEGLAGSGVVGAVSALPGAGVCVPLVAGGACSVGAVDA